MSNINDMNRYAMKQNDVGVNQFVVFGDLDAALLHFHKALAAKLATENQLLASTENNEETLVRPTVDMEIPEIQSIAPTSVCTSRYNQVDTSSDDATGASKQTSDGKFSFISPVRLNVFLPSFISFQS